MVVSLEGRGDQIRAVGNPIKFEEGRTQFTAPPRLGAHTGDVLRSFLGYDDTKLAELAANGAIATQADKGEAPADA
jgi:crotonobetainyl-CoA:carnitine CoA-transferase CaiB-like acyl-CoA transferase